MQYRWRTQVEHIDTTHGEKLYSAGDKINTFVYNLSSDWYQFVNIFQDAQSNQIVNIPFNRADTTVVDYLTADMHPQWELMQNLMMDKYEQVPVDIRVKLIRWYFEPYLMQQKTAINDTARVVYLDSSTGLFKFANNRALFNNYVDTTGVIGNIYPLNANTPLSGSFDLIINGTFYDFGHTDMKPGEIYYLTDDMDGWIIPYSEGGKANNLSIPFAVALHKNAGVLLTDRAITKDLPCYPLCPPVELQFQKEIVPTPTPTPTSAAVTCTDPVAMTCEAVTFHARQYTDEPVVNKSVGPELTNTGVVPISGNKLLNNWSLNFNGASNLTVPHTTNFPYAFGGGDFTIEFQIFPTNQPSNACIVQNSINVQDNSNSWGWLVLYTGGRIMFGYSSTGKAGTGVNNSWKFPLTTTTVPVMNAWSHVAFVREGDNIFSYLDGQLISTGSFGGDSIFAPIAPLIIGRRDLADHFTGQLQDIRISNRAVYTGDCIDMPTSLLPATLPPANVPNISQVDVLYQPESDAELWSPHVLAGFTSPTTVTPSVSHVNTPGVMGIGAVDIFNGHVELNNTLSAASFLQSSNESYTVECYVRLDQVSADTQVIYSEVETSSNIGTGLFLTPVGGDAKFVYTVYNGTGAAALTLSSTTTPQSSKWYHVAITNDGSGGADMYINGDSEDSKNWNGGAASDSTNPLRIGKSPVSDSHALSGYMQSLRITNTLVYQRGQCIDYMTQPQVK